MEFKVYRSKCSQNEVKPVGEMQAHLRLKDGNKPVWLQLSEEFKTLCLPWFEEPTEWDTGDSLRELTPYSEEALRYLAEIKLPTFGFVMVQDR